VPGEIKAAGRPPARPRADPSVNRLVGVFPARIDALARVAAFVEEVAALAEFSRHDCLRLGLVLEELFTNTVEHGYGGDSEAPVQVTCDVQRGRVAVTYEDAAPGFNPLAILQPPDEGPAAGERVPGKLGLVLVARMASDLDYARAEGRNRVSLVVLAAR
jgi:serine/threonine-protein kinase RsbW